MADEVSRGTSGRSPETPGTTPVEPWSAEEMLRAEIDHLRDRSAAPRAAGESHADAADRLKLSALCLSGGGIRSAAFCLGVLQALAREGLLRQFNYLSTVSGGGFIGGWLQMLIRQRKGVEAAEAALGGTSPEALCELRGQTNYLTPRTGLFSADTWTAILLYLRNLLLNWTVLLPLFLAVPLVLVFHRTLVWQLAALPHGGSIALLCAGAILFVGARAACTLLPSHAVGADGGTPYAAWREVAWYVVVPALAWALLVPVALRGWLEIRPLALGFTPGQQLALPAAYLAVMLAAYGAAAWRQRRAHDPGLYLYRRNLPAWLLASLGAAAMLWLALRLGNAVLLKLADGAKLADEATRADWATRTDWAEVLTTLAPLCLVTVSLLQTVFYVGLRREARLAEMDREWLARANGIILLAAIGWTAAALCCLTLPRLAFLEPQQAGNWAKELAWTTALGTLFSGPLVAWLGKQARTRVETALETSGRTQRLGQVLLPALAVVFAACLLALLGGLLQSVLGWAQGAIGTVLGLPSPASPLLPLLLQVLAGAALYFATRRAGTVNVNRFSMHGLYRNRLSRAFLGSARGEERRPDPFTGFDPADNPRFVALTRAPGDALFPVVNMTLNLSATSNTAWTERKAASFTATPLACGSAALRRPERPGKAGRGEPGAYVATSGFAGKESDDDQGGADGGAQFGSLLTISGAAVSPNWGYHSSPITAFLMTLFNVRLGAWVPNPAVATPEERALAKPKNSVLALVSELFGRTTGESQAVYLSDGGHFDNLGLYEMLRRRCARILVIDAGQDEGCAFLDLGSAIRRAHIDQLVEEIAIDTRQIRSRGTIEKDATGAAVLGLAMGDIRYSGGASGKLIYVKPSFLPAIPAEVRAYGTANPLFPHENTADQWFSESQFESYRALGAFQLGELLRQVPGKGGLEEVFSIGEAPPTQLTRAA